jgi:hypothetical protein
MVVSAIDQREKLGVVVFPSSEEPSLLQLSAPPVPTIGETGSRWGLV